MVVPLHELDFRPYGIGWPIDKNEGGVKGKILPAVFSAGCSTSPTGKYSVLAGGPLKGESIARSFLTLTKRRGGAPLLTLFEKWLAELLAGSAKHVGVRR